MSIVTIDREAVYHCSFDGDQLVTAVAIASLPDLTVYMGHWYGTTPEGEVLANGWTRFESANVSHAKVSLSVCRKSDVWLSQANHIFSHLQTASNLGDYAIVKELHFAAQISATTKYVRGFLFLCPPSEFQTGPSSFRWPDCPAYWSLEPSGVERLTRDEATQVGLPSLRLETYVEGYFWDASVYVGLRKFHEAKGFDPESQDVARRLGHPLYQLSVGLNAPHVNSVSRSQEQEDQDAKPGDDFSEVRNELLTPHEEPAPASKFIMNVQMALILFLALF
ncbi:hypothetical protein B0H19DRAFT_1063399 [Mycena capillaripes]|nr:hypothetical protein B0H19DRAFT_1063399 [Mycena capillaripes]